jgi:hypothetical protein
MTTHTTMLDTMYRRAQQSPGLTRYQTIKAHEMRLLHSIPASFSDALLWALYDELSWMDDIEMIGYLSDEYDRCDESWALVLDFNLPGGYVPSHGRA